MQGRWRQVTGRVGVIFLSLVILYGLAAAVVFDFSAAGHAFDEEYHNGRPVAFGPRPRWPFCAPHYQSGFDGEEWPFAVFAPLCAAWRYLAGYAPPAKLRRQ